MEYPAAGHDIMMPVPSAQTTKKHRVPYRSKNQTPRQTSAN